MARSGSKLLSDEQIPIWADLPEFEQDSAATRLLEGIETSMMTEAEALLTLPEMPDVIPGFDYDQTGGFPFDFGFSGSVHIEENINAEVSVIDLKKIGIDQKTQVFPERLKKQKRQMGGSGDDYAMDTTNDDVKLFIDDYESVVMPISQLKKYSKNDMAKVVYIQYRNLERFMGFTADFPTFNDSFYDKDEFDPIQFPKVGKSRSQILNSRIVTISIGDRRLKMELDEPVVFTLKHEKVSHI